MKKVLSIVLALTLFLGVSGCSSVQNANKTQKGAVIGVAGGALLGGLIGGNLKGALIGAAIGGAAGGVIGNQMDKQAKEIEEVVPGAEVERVGEGIQIIFDENSGVTFATNKAELNAQSKENLNKVAKIFEEFPDTNLLVQGHTDNTGADDYNLALSRRRAEAVSAYLQANGVDASRIKIEALGETLPRFDNSTAEGRSKNRRVEIAVTANAEMIREAQAKAN